MKIGVRLELLGLPFRKAVEAAGRLGVAGVQMNVGGDIAPAKLSQSGRREFRHLLRVHELELSALNCPLQHGLDTSENLEPRIDYVKQVMTLAYDLGPGIVTLQAGCVDGKDDSARLDILREALAALGTHGDRVGTTLALETGLESGETLAAFLAGIDTGSLGVNFDPANLYINGFHPIDDLRHLRGLVYHVQAKDARRHSANRALQEVPLGHGELDWMLMTQYLEDMVYSGFLVVSRDVGSARLPEIEAGAGMLRRFIG